MDSEVFSRIRDYLAEQLEVEPEKITADSDIVNDFGADRDVYKRQLQAFSIFNKPCIPAMNAVFRQSPWNIC